MIRLGQSSRQMQFESAILPHLDAGYSLARFLVRNEQDAKDVLQDASLRAFRSFDSFRGQNSRAWFLQIVRNTSFTRLKHASGHREDVLFDEELHTPANPDPDVASRLDQAYDRETVRAAIERLAPEFCEVITLRELEQCSYKEIAEIASIPVGTVMSRLARARAQLAEILCKTYMKED